MAADSGGALLAHIQTWRPYTLWYVGLVGLAGAGLAGGPHDLSRFAVAWAAPTVGWIGGHYLGDYFDRGLDAISKPHRPIPSGRLPAGTALGCGCACLAVLGALSVSGGWGTTAVAVLAGAGIIGYGRWLKARGFAGNLVRGGLGALALLYGALSAGPPAPGNPAGRALLVFAVAFWMHDAMSNLVGTLRDVAGDRAGGYRTLPVRHGVRPAVRTTLLLYGLALTAATGGGVVLARGGRLGWYLTALAAAAVLGAAAMAPLRSHQDQVPVRLALRAHAVLVLERLVFAGAVLELGVGLTWAALLVAPALGLTWWTQQAMRADHELGPAARAGSPATIDSGHRSDAL